MTDWNPGWKPKQWSAGWNEGWKSSKPQGSKPQDKSKRERLTWAPIPGKVHEWKGSYGWIEPQLEIQHPEIIKHQGHIFVHPEDVVPKWTGLPAGALVEFHLYFDGDGLGAEECYARKVLRLTVPRVKARLTFGDEGERLPDFEQVWQVTVRAYEWVLVDGSHSDMEFLLFEIWGRPQALVDAIVELSKDERRFNPRLLVPETRLWKLDLVRLQEQAQRVELSNDLTITVPMPCRTLILGGTQNECKAAIWLFIGQVCD
jgi:hypothetical protein